MRKKFLWQYCCNHAGVSKAMTEQIPQQMSCSGTRQFSETICSQFADYNRKSDKKSKNLLIAISIQIDILTLSFVFEGNQRRYVMIVLPFVSTVSQQLCERVTVVWCCMVVIMTSGV